MQATRSHTKVQDKAKPEIENTSGLHLAVVKLATVQESNLLS
jgi:hypothetical protein